MKLIIPMAGKGSRFVQQGIITPKPLVYILGKPLVNWATDSIPFINPSDMIFIALKEHEEKYKITTVLKYIYGTKINIILLDDVTEGPACTVLKAKDLVGEEEDVIALDCDLYFQAPLLKTIMATSADGILCTITENDPNKSYVKIEGNKVVQIAEKNPISDKAIIGAYYFRHWKNFAELAEKMIKDDRRQKNEFFISTLYQMMVEKGMQIITVPATEYWDLGTPDAVMKFVRASSE